MGDVVRKDVRSVSSVLKRGMCDCCMIVNILLATGNKLNCFISAREPLAIILPCALMLWLFCFVFC